MTENASLLLDRSSAVGFIGPGRLGSSLALALANAGYRVAAAWGRRDEAAAALAARIDGCRVARRAQEVVDAARIVFVATADGAIKPVCDALAWRPGKAAVHCSGATAVAALASAQRAGAAIGGFHPLQTFPGPDSWDRLAGVTCAVESPDDALREWLESLATALGGRPFALRPEQRAAYHASAVMACGLVSGLAGLAAEMWEEFGLSRAEGLAALRPMLAATVEAIGERGLPEAMTGPYVRGDVETVLAHLEATKARGRDALRAYAAIALASLPIAAEQGRLSDARRRTITDALENALSHHGA